MGLEVVFLRENVSHLTKTLFSFWTHARLHFPASLAKLCGNMTNF